MGHTFRSKIFATSVLKKTLNSTICLT